MTCTWMICRYSETFEASIFCWKIDKQNTCCNINIKYIWWLKQILFYYSGINYKNFEQRQRLQLFIIIIKMLYINLNFISTFIHKHIKSHFSQPWIINRFLGFSLNSIENTLHRTTNQLLNCCHMTRYSKLWLINREIPHLFQHKHIRTVGASSNVKYIRWLENFHFIYH